MDRKRIILNIVVVCLILFSLYILQNLLMPKYVSAIVEGSLIEEYYNEKADYNHDIIFIGDCEVYESFSPISLWKNYGITSYIRGSAQQLIWQSYYLLEETLKYETPEIVVFNVLAMQYNEPQKEAYNRLTLDGMRMSASKIRAVKASMMEDERLIDYIFPILRYHSRWNELTSEDFKYIFKKDKLFHNGYYMRVDVKPVTSIPRGRKLANYQFGDTAYLYLDKITKLCKDNGIELVLVKVPSIYPVWYDQWEQQIEDYASKNDLLYINFLELIDEVGIDYSKDTYDAGLHMNLTGAEKLSLYLGDVLTKTYDLTDKRTNKEYQEIWQEKIDFYEQMKAQQYYELEKYGYLKSFGAKAPED